MNREEYAFAYNINGTRMSGIITMTNPPKLVCYCDEENSKTILKALNPSLPPAEGADEILASLIKSLGEPDNSIHDHSYEIRPLTVNGKCEWWMFHNGVGSGEPLAQWLQNFATLHAQRIAEKMVSERLGNQPLLKKIFDRLNDIDPDLLASIMDQIEREGSHD